MSRVFTAPLLAAALAACAQLPNTASPNAASAAPAPAAAPMAGMDHSTAAMPAAAGRVSNQEIETPIIGRNGQAIGRAFISEGPKGVLMRLEFLAGALPPGWHGAHLHGVGRCDDFAAGFQASGGHVGKAPGVAHGLLNPQGPEAGDLPNVFSPDGGAKFGAELFSPFVSVFQNSEGRVSLFDADGTALILHANADDQVTQPIGGAGERIACAALPAPQRVTAP